MKKRYILTLIVGSIILMFSIGYSVYTIASALLYSDEFNLTKDESTNLCKVQYQDTSGTIVYKIEYKEAGDTISSQDVPFITENNKIYEWVGNNGIVINTILGNEYIIKPVDENIILKPMVVDNVVTKGGNDIVSSGSYVESSDNYVKLKENTSNNGNVTNEVTTSGIIENVNLSATYVNGSNGKEEVINDLKYYESSGFLGLTHTFVSQVNNDTTISLEDSKDKSNNELYKPILNEKISENYSGDKNKNYCVSRIILNGDLILTGGTTLNIGARTGFYGNSPEFSQHDFQGFIIGQYSEIDLNGHNLIIGMGCSVFAYGSITDKIGGGSIIVENGGTLLGTMVVEDQSHETAMPVSFAKNDAPFCMYRMPYLNCNIKVCYGGTLKGQLRIDFEGNGDTVFDDTISIIGIKDSIFNLYDDDSYVVREVEYDKNLFETSINTTINEEQDADSFFSSINLMHQKFSYKFYNHNSSYIDVTLPTLFVDFKGLGLSIDLDKGLFKISPYLKFYLYNTKVKIKNNFTFLPGSYLYVDTKSEIKLSAGSFKTYNKPSSILGKLGDVLNSSSFQSVGGLNFANSVADFVEANDKYITADDDLGTNKINRPVIFFSATLAWKYFNKNQPAKCDLYGKITFDQEVDIKGYGTSVNGYYNGKSYMLGGTINIYDFEAFKMSINECTNYKCTLYNSTFKSGPNKGKTKNLITFFGDYAFNVTDYFCYPLVSNGQVLMNPENPIEIRLNYKTNDCLFNFENGIVTYTNDENKIVYYAYIFSNDGLRFNNSCDYLYKAMAGTSESQYLDSSNDLSGEYFNITVNSDNTITRNNSKYIYYRGAYLPYSFNGSTYQIDISKLRSGVQSLGGGNSRAVIYDNNSYYGYDTWRLS